MNNRLFSLITLLLVSAQAILAQNINVRGTVVDEQGETLPGVTVYVKGSKAVTSTDIDGVFQIDGINPAAKLEFVYVGMQKVEMKAEPEMKVVLKPESAMLDGVIVTAFGTAKKSSFTGSAAVIDSQQIESKQVTNVLQTLVGEIPGLEVAPSTGPGTTQSMTIRGAGSINAGTEPLIVVDGMPYEGEMNGINPNIVESITVLKDAASSALYGARGANGVILITTKKGNKGDARVTLDARWGSNSRMMPDYDRITDPGQYYETYYKALYNSYINNGLTASQAYHKANQTLCGPMDVGGLGYNVYTVPNNEYLIGTNGQLNPNASLGRLITNNGQQYWLQPDNWTDETYMNGFRQEYNITISGGNDKATVYGSLGYLENNGIVAASDFDRISGSLSATYKAKEWLNFGGNFIYAHTNRNYAYSQGNDGDSYYLTGGVFSDAANLAPIYPLYVRDANGQIMTDANGKVYDWGNGAYNENSQQRPPLINNNNLNCLDVNYYKNSSNNMVADAYLDVTLPLGFKITVKGGANLYESRIKNGVNPYYGYYVASGGLLSVTHDRTFTYNFQQLLNWDRSFGEHNINLMVGHENYNYTYNYLSGEKEGAVDFKGITELNGYLNFPTSPTSYSEDYNTEGYLIRGMYDFMDRYFLQASYRRDASSRFHPSHRWGNFWSLGGAWILTREDWLSNVSWLNTLKLKVSYGEVGNDNIGAYRYADLYTINNVNSELGLLFYQKGNKDISWETLGNLNAGIEFDLFNSRLKGSLDFYNKCTSDMLLWFTVPRTLGYSGYYKNVGDMRNTGVELTLNATPIRNKLLVWNINFNFAYNDQKVTYLPEANQSMNVDGHAGFQSGNDYYIGEGLPLYAFYIAKSAGLNDEGRQQWYTTGSDGSLVPTTDYSSARKFTIDGYQRVRGGFGTSLSIYGFDLNVQFAYGIGGKSFDAEYAALMTNPMGSTVGYALHKDILNAWTPENTDTEVQRWSYGDAYTGIISDRYLVNASYLNFQNAQIGYTLPDKWTRALRLERLRVYCAADNIWLWSARKGFDPRLTQGYGSYSPMRTISAGINIQF